MHLEKAMYVNPAPHTAVIEMTILMNVGADSYLSRLTLTSSFRNDIDGEFYTSFHGGSACNLAEGISITPS